MPCPDSTGKIPFSLVLAFWNNPNILGMDGPVISASRTATECPFSLIDAVSKEVTRDFPTPPFPLTTPMTFFICEPVPDSSISFFGSLRSEHSLPHSLQLLEHSFDPLVSSHFHYRHSHAYPHRNDALHMYAHDHDVCNVHPDYTPDFH